MLVQNKRRNFTGSQVWTHGVLNLDIDLGKRLVSGQIPESWRLRDYGVAGQQKMGKQNPFMAIEWWIRGEYHH